MNYIIIFFFIIICSNAKSQKTDSILTNIGSKKYIIRNIKVLNNKQTKEKIILNELDFTADTEIDSTEISKLLTQNHQNISNLSLFNFVYIDYNISENKYLDLTITVEERWYLVPEMSFEIEEQNLNHWIHNIDYHYVSFGAGLVKYNFRGLNEKLLLFFIYGYKNSLHINYLHIKLDKKHKHLLGFYLNYQQQHSIDYTTFNNQALGITLDSDNAKLYFDAILSYKYRKNIYENLTFFLKYNFQSINDTIFLLNPLYYNLQKKINYISLMSEYEYSNLDNKIYPTYGEYVKISFLKIANLTRKDNVNLFNLRLTFKKLIKLSDIFFYGNQIIVFFSNPKNISYNFFYSLRREYYIRGFEHYTITGSQYLLQQNSIRYKLIADKILYLKFIPFRKFNKIPLSLYLSAHSDFGYVKDFTKMYLTNNNDLNNRLLYGYGLGIDFSTYYDKVLRIEYSFNNFYEHGIFFAIKSVF